MQDLRCGFRIVGAISSERRYTPWVTAFNGYAACDPRAQVKKESYLSAFTFGDAFKKHLETTRSSARYYGECFASYIWLDIDRQDDINGALTDARRLVSLIETRYGLEDPLGFFSGSKGFHIGLPTSILDCEPSVNFNRYARAIAEKLAALANIKIDTSVYDKVRAFRAPNSLHPRTRLHKRFLTQKELLHLRAEKIIELSQSPEPFEILAAPSACANAVRDWKEAVDSVDNLLSAEKLKIQCGELKTALNRATLEFIQQGAPKGSRGKELYQAAANLKEFNCPDNLAHALLTKPALDSGLPPSEVKRQIDCGLRHTKKIEGVLP